MASAVAELEGQDRHLRHFFFEGIGGFVGRAVIFDQRFAEFFRGLEQTSSSSRWSKKLRLSIVSDVEWIAHRYDETSFAKCDRDHFDGAASSARICFDNRRGITIETNRLRPKSRGPSERETSEKTSANGATFGRDRTTFVLSRVSSRSAGRWRAQTMRNMGRIAFVVDGDPAGDYQTDPRRRCAPFQSDPGRIWRNWSVVALSDPLDIDTIR